MAKSKSESQKGTYTLEENLALTNEELTSNWSKFASLIRQVENIKWDQAKKKAIRLLENQEEAFEYIDSVRSQEPTEPESVVVDDFDKSDAKPKSDKSKSKAAPKPTTKMDRYSNNYKRLLRLAPGIEQRLLDGEEIYGKIPSGASKGINIELLFQRGDDYHLALSNYYKENGDMIADPDMEVRFNVKQQMVEALHFQNRYGYFEVYDDKIKRKMVSTYQKKHQNNFLEVWLLELLADEGVFEWLHIEQQPAPVSIPRRSKGESATTQVSDVPESTESTQQSFTEQPTESEEVESTVKHWTKLAAVIQEVEGVSPDEAKEKALKLKKAKDGSAEDYVIKAFVELRKHGLDNQLKKNYTLLIELLPDLLVNTSGDFDHAFIVLPKKAGYKLEIAADINKSTKQFALHGDDEDSLLLAVQKIRKRAWVTVASGAFFGQSMSEGYMAESHIKSDPVHLEINRQFEKWLVKVNKKKLEVIWGKTLSMPLEKSEQSDVEKELTELRSNYPIVLEWTEGNGDDMRGFETLEGLEKALLENGYTNTPNETYVKNKVHFKGYDTWSRIDVSKKDGDYDPENVRLLDWLQNTYDRNFDWSQFSEQKQGNLPDGKLMLNDFQLYKVGDLVTRHKNNYADNKIYRVKALEGYSEFDDDFKVTIEDSLGVADELIEEAFLRLVMRVEDYDTSDQSWKNKVIELSQKPVSKKADKRKKKIDLLFTRAGGYTVASDKSRQKNGDYVKIAILSTPVKYFEKDLPQSVVDEIEFMHSQDLLALRKWTLKDEAARVSKVEMQPQQQVDLKQPKESGNEKSEAFDLERAKEDAKTIPDYEPGKVEFHPAHKRAGFTQRHINWINKHKQGMILIARKNPINNTKNLQKDFERRAMKPGKRISRTGKIYYEGRSNRSDLGKEGL